MSDFVHRKLWIPVDPNSDADVITLNGGPGKIFKGGEVMFCLALFDVMPKSVAEPGTFLNHALLASFLLKIRSGSYAGTLLLDSSSVGAVVTIDPTVTELEFIQRQKAPIQIYCPSTLTAIAPGSLYMTLTGATNDTPGQPDGFGRGGIVCEDIGIGAVDSVAPGTPVAVSTDLFNAFAQQCVKWGKNPAGRTFELVSPDGTKGRMHGTDDDGQPIGALMNY